MKEPLIMARKMRLAALCLLLLIVHSIVIILLAGPVLKTQMSQDHLLFAKMSARTVAEAYDGYYASGYYKFREIVGEVMRMNPNLKTLRLYDVEGRLLFNSQEFSQGRTARTGALVEPEMMAAIKSLEITCRLAQDGEGHLDVIVPHIEDWGRHRVSVRYLFNYRTWKDRRTGLILRLILAGAITLMFGFGLIILTEQLVASRQSHPRIRGKAVAGE